jgi:membrane fusion protein (multidrug efflux system)
MKIRQILIIVVSVISLLMFGLVSYISYNMGMDYGEQNAEDIRKSRITNSLAHKKIIKSVSVIKVTNSGLQSEITSSGRVVSLNKISISSEVSGKLEGNFSIKKGTAFRKGDVLFKVKDTDIKLLADAKKSQFMNLLSSNLADIKLDFPSEYKKWDEFFNSITLNSHISSLPETTTSKEKNFISSKEIMAGYLSVKSDEEKLKKYTVRATFDGVITKSYTDIGANVNMGSPVIDVISSGNMEVELTVNTSEIEFIEVGNSVSFTDSTTNFKGEIIRQGSFVNENTQNISVFAEINAGTELLYSGMYLNATITSNFISDVCKIPRRALFANNKIFIVNSENKLEIRSVNIISDQGNNVLVDNLSNNTMVVSEPLIDAKEETIVKPIVK